MKKKQFELHQVLTYRTDIEKMRMQEFAAAKQRYEEACTRLERILNELQVLNREYAERNGQFESIVELQLYNDFFAHKREEIRQQQVQIEQLNEALEERREEMVQATKDKKVLEALKDKKEEEFRKTQQQKERDFLDEISVQKKGRE